MASNMGIPEKKTDTLLYIIIVCCIIAFPVIVLAGYTLEMTADKNGNIQAFEAIGSLTASAFPAGFCHCRGRRSDAVMPQKAIPHSRPLM